MILTSLPCSRSSTCKPAEAQDRIQTLRYAASIKLISTLLLLLCASWIPCIGQALQSSFVDSSKLKPSIVLILPQSFKVPTNSAGTSVPGHKLQQYVALINNVQSERHDQLIRQEYKRLSLQVRDAQTPITGQLFYEHIFDYFPSSKPYMMLPIDLDQVSPIHEHLGSRSYAATLLGSEPALNRKAQHLVISIRPHQISTGFGSDSIELVSSASVPVEPVPSSDGRHSFAIVQTDKPVYKPEDKVRIRSLVVNENLRPVTRDELRLQVKNPHKIIVEEIRFPNNITHKDPNKDPLYLDHIFEFPPEPMLGTWTLHLLHSDPIANDSTSFEVKEYVLPNYEIEFESPKYILPSTSSISGYIIAKYHHGKPVQGKAYFKFGFKESANARPKFIARSSIKSIDPNSGRVDFRINSDKFKETDWFPGIAGSRFFIEATVTETATGHREIAHDSSCMFISTPYKISFEDSIEDFKAGLSQQLTVQVLEMQTNKPAPAGIRVLAEYKDQSGNSLQPSNSLNKSTSEQPNLSGEALTDRWGRASFQVGPLGEQISILHVTIKWLNSSYQATDNRRELFGNELAVGHHTLMRYESQNGYISLMNKSMTHLNVNDEFVSDILVREAIVKPQRIFYLVVTRGQILALEDLQPDGQVRFTLTEAMMPSIRLVLFALTSDSEGLLSDSMRINVAQDLNCGLRLSYHPSSKRYESGDSSLLRPNDKGFLKVTARPGDLVSLIGVDSAVYSLNNRSRFESSRIVQRIKRLDTGCGFGGGRNNLDVFWNAGLSLFRDVADETEASTRELPESSIGSSCLTMQNQLRHIEDVQLGYSRPGLSGAAQTKPRYMELMNSMRNRIFGPNNQHQTGANSPMLSIASRRFKRESDAEQMMRRYHDPVERSCCHLGTLEDIPQQRNCSSRARIVDKYMRHGSSTRSCSKIYLECCRAVFGEQVLMVSSIISSRDTVEPPIIESKVLASHYTPLLSEAVVVSNVGHLDRIEMDTLTRKDFRETWLFELVSVDAEGDGQTELQVQLPHSITSWSISAMALNKQLPMCIMPRALKLTTFQEIFLHIAMPYKVIQGEQIDLVATIFNYSPQTQEVLVYMYGVEDVCSEAEAGERSDRKRVRLDKHSSISVLFPMIPLKTGKYNIKILALTSSSGRSDIVDRQLNVVPRGRSITDETTFSLDPLNQQRRSKRAIQTGNLVDEIDSSKGMQRSRVRLTPTRDSEYIVPNTQECIVSAIGDKMGQTVQTSLLDVENLIRLPHGCGEQVMIYLGPTLYTTRYLSSMNKLSGDLRWRAIRYIQSGYKRILNYRKENGSFSAFARRDASIWLTAFVAKLLCQTERTPFVAEEIHIDRTVVNSALSWLIEQQNEESGTWLELNPVYHREMLGGILKENALTAFVILALNECIHHAPDLVSETGEPAGASGGSVYADSEGSSSSGYYGHTNGQDTLRLARNRAEQALLLDRYRAVKEKNPYVMALSAYALSFSRPSEAVSVLNDLLAISERSNNRNHLFWRGQYPIETASYALQALMELSPLLSSSPTPSSNNKAWMPGMDGLAIANWLTSKRSFTGAFESTQDTVVALEALSKFAQLQSSPNGLSLLPQGDSSASQSHSLSCQVSISNRTRRSIEFRRDNAQILQTLRLGSLELERGIDESIDILTVGNGLGTMSVKLKYNVFQEEDELCKFEIVSSIQEWRPPSLRPPKISPQDPTQSSESAGTPAGSGSSSDFEDDYFKSFDQSMLSELNLVSPTGREEQQQQRRNQENQKQDNERSQLLRFKRFYEQTNADSDHWGSRFLSSLRASLPSWLVPAQSSTTPKPEPEPLGQRPATLHLATLAPSNGQQLTGNSFARRNNTARRSAASSSVPLVVQPSSIPSDAKLNTLSLQIDSISQVGSNQSSTLSSDSDQADHRIQQNAQSSSSSVEPSSHRLVLLLQTCVHYLSNRRDSEMAVIEVGIISGFKPNEADLKEILDSPGTPAMKYEVSQDRSMVIIYLQHIPSSGQFCIQFRLIRDSLVYNLQSGYIRAYEYYSPTHSCSNYYTPSRVSDLLETKCDSSGQVCQCATKSVCPPSEKLLDLAQIHAFNTTSARNRLMQLVCSSKFDLVSLVKLRWVRHLETGKVFRLGVKVKSDIRGNLTKIMELQRQQQRQLASGDLGPNRGWIELIGEQGDEAESMQQLDQLSLSLDTTCVHNDPLLLHFAHPNQRKQGGELMILMTSRNKLEKRYSRLAGSKQARSWQSKLVFEDGGSPASVAPRPKPTIMGGLTDTAGYEAQEWRKVGNLFEDTHQFQYSLGLQLDRESILHDMAYQSTSEPRKSINELLLWLELRVRREHWTCT